MTLQEFKTWLQGFLDAKQGGSISAQDVQKIMFKLDTVRESPPSIDDIKKAMEKWKPQVPYTPGKYPVWPAPKPYHPNDFWPGGVQPSIFGPCLVTGTDYPNYKLNVSTCLMTGEENVPTAGNSKGSACCTQGSCTCRS